MAILPGILRRRSHSVEQLAVRHSNCFFCDNFQESTQDSFIYPVILLNINSSVAYCAADMLCRLINCRIIIIIIKGSLSLSLAPVLHGNC